MVKTNEVQVLEEARYMFYSEIRKRGLVLGREDLRDLEQFVILRCIRAIKYQYSKSKGAKLTSYLWFVIDCAIKDYLNKENKVRFLEAVSLEELRQNEEEGKTGDWYLEDKREKSFSVKLLEVLSKYEVGEDLFRLLIGDMDIPNAIRSVSASKEKGVGWIERWLGRKLTEEESRCLEDVKELLQ